MIGTCVASFNPVENQFSAVKWMAPTALVPALSSNCASAFKQMPVKMKPNVVRFIAGFLFFDIVGNDHPAWILRDDAHWHPAL
jgi:hypothetical protein